MVGETTGEIEIPSQANQGTEEIAASGDAFVIADAIYGGLQLIAAAIDRYTVSMNDEEETDERQGELYLDGSRMK